MTPSIPDRQHLVLVGGGHTHALVLKMFAMAPEPGLRITLIAKELEAPYSGMLPGLIAGHYKHDDCHIDLLRLCAWAGVRFVHGEVIGLDRAARQVLIAGRPPLGFDLLSIDIGIAPDFGNIAGAQEHAVPVKPVSTFTERWRAVSGAIERPGGPRNIVVVGAGAAGYELILAVRHAVLSRTSASQDGFQFSLVGHSLLPRHNPRARALARQELASQHVALVEGRYVTQVLADALVLDNGQRLPADAVLVSTKAAPAPWLKASGLPCDADGFVAVRPTLQILDDDDIFAAGDCAAVLDHPREKAGVFAVRQGRPLTDNLRRRFRGEAARPFRPQSQFLTLVSAGRTSAIAARGSFAASGAWAWRWKDRIDRAFMKKFHELPRMSSSSTAPKDMRCAGCAAKIGPRTLKTALDRLGPSVHPRDDAAIIDDGGPMLRLETIDFFRSFWGDPYVFGRIAAVHAMSDIFAKGGRPTHALANVVLPHAAPRLTAEDLFQVVAGARDAFARDGVTVVGGHSSEGLELSAGYFVSGFVDRSRLLRKATLSAGDCLILTRPLGTGILFAALMRDLVRGRTIDRVVTVMQQSHAETAGVIARYPATACTDITGFGLLGHLVEMMTPTELSVRLNLDAIPLYPEVLALARNGVASTLFPDNLQIPLAVEGPATTMAGTLPVLFDPQTSGGLLIAVPAEQATACLADLEAVAPYAAIIGRVVAPERDQGRAVHLDGMLRETSAWTP